MDDHNIRSARGTGLFRFTKPAGSHFVQSYNTSKGRFAINNRGLVASTSGSASHHVTLPTKHSPAAESSKDVDIPKPQGNQCNVAESSKVADILNSNPQGNQCSADLGSTNDDFGTLKRELLEVRSDMKKLGRHHTNWLRRDERIRNELQEIKNVLTNLLNKVEPTIPISTAVEESEPTVVVINSQVPIRAGFKRKSSEKDAGSKKFKKNPITLEDLPADCLVLIYSKLEKQDRFNLTLSAPKLFSTLRDLETWQDVSIFFDNRHEKSYRLLPYLLEQEHLKCLRIDCDARCSTHAQNCESFRALTKMLRRLIDFEFFEIQTLELVNTERLFTVFSTAAVNDFLKTAANFISRQKNLKGLSLSGSWISVKHATYLIDGIANLHSLSTLNISELVKFESIQLNDVSQMFSKNFGNLRILVLDNCLLCEKVIKEIAKFEALESLEVLATDVSIYQPGSTMWQTLSHVSVCYTIYKMNLLAAQNFSRIFVKSMPLTKLELHLDKTLSESDAQSSGSYLRATCSSIQEIVLVVTESSSIVALLAFTRGVIKMASLVQLKVMTNKNFSQEDENEVTKMVTSLRTRKLCFTLDQREFMLRPSLWNSLFG
ncbi:uncharacterized protein LOC106052852 isoform X2 [Biomphalaria glabrata]|uniref:Uncharacterized protein LOC106052852 isoform X2 n=1 Tax=Biomphalaria glabrata TaxID=6526 RepID=A0A9W2Z3V0_BIOGL|nr:uncharacterized protein LOC106052852 isoform X2 [Biomphalaria glabrata]